MQNDPTESWFFSIEVQESPLNKTNSNGNSPLGFFQTALRNQTIVYVFCGQTVPSAGLICTCLSSLKIPCKPHLVRVNTGYTQTQTKSLHYLSYNTRLRLPGKYLLSLDIPRLLYLC